MSAHRRDQQAIHRPLGGLEQISRLGGIEAATPGGRRELVVKGRPEAEETLDGLAERQSEPQGDRPVVGGRSRRLVEVMCGGFRLRRVEELEEARSQDVAPLTEQEALLVREGEDPRQLRRDVPSESAVRARDARRREGRAPDRWAS